ncbi:MAG: hypothetical protein HY038_14030 [Nitrospirae bacterium]|jgi:hypothetical protein|nr:hypothetical protein [Nitrospirota bacterium]
MNARRPFDLTREIECTLYDFIRYQGTMTFGSLANLLPQHRWVSLFKALYNLERQQVVTLTPLPWDYEISVHRNPDQKSPT